MRKLKTLKDLCDDDWYEEKDIYTIDANEVVDLTKEELKAEAVKWVKELRRKTGTTGKLDYRLSFKEFFNIIEEDLDSLNETSKSEEKR